MLSEMKLNEFVDELASSSPAPGGGSVAAVNGALGAALISMVCRLTIRKKGYEQVQDEMQQVLVKADELHQNSVSLIDQDTDAFNSLMAAFKLPKETESEAAKRSEVIQAGYIKAADIPLNIAENCLQILKLADHIKDKGNKNAISDIGVAAETSYAGLESAIMNVKINLGSIKDQNYKTACSREIKELHEEGLRLKNQVLETINKELD
jgi:formiminotetrahydrofolate cyclodeaminase